GSERISERALIVDRPSDEARVVRHRQVELRDPIALELSLAQDEVRAAPDADAPPRGHERTWIGVGDEVAERVFVGETAHEEERGVVSTAAAANRQHGVALAILRSRHLRRECGRKSETTPQPFDPTSVHFPLPLNAGCILRWGCFAPI